MELTYYSTLFLTVLLLIGLVSFIRGSIKDRTTELQLTDGDGVRTKQVRSFLLQLGYQVVHVDPDRDTVILEGQVQSSIFLASLLTILATIGLGCLGLVLSLLLPELGNVVWLIFLGGPLAGIFYWKGASRAEKITLASQSEDILWIQGHRDTLRKITEIARSSKP